MSTICCVYAVSDFARRAASVHFNRFFLSLLVGNLGTTNGLEMDIAALIHLSSTKQGCHLAFFETKSGKFGLIFTALVAKKKFCRKMEFGFKMRKFG